MPNRADLIERSGDLKQDLLEFVGRRRFRRELDRVLREQLGRARIVAEEQIGNVLDFFLLQHRLSDGRTVVDHFVEAHPELPEKERTMLLGWRDVVEGVFEVQRRDGDALLASNLVDDLTYRIHSNMGARALAPMRRGAFLITRLVPVHDVWLLSGFSSILPRSDRAAAYQLATKLALEHPRLVFRNPEKLSAAWELQRRDYDDFVAFFGTDTLVLPGRDLPEQMRRYMHHKLYEARDGEGRTAAERSSATYGTTPPPIEMPFDDDLLSAETVGVLYDERDGMWFFRDFGRVAETFATSELVKERRHREAVRAYVQSSDIAPLPIRRLAGRDIGRANQVLQVVLKQPDFDWRSDGEALLRRYKADYFDRPQLPSIAPISDRLAELELTGRLTEGAAASQAQPGQNDPCPCGSGKKLKRCCGR